MEDYERGGDEEYDNDDTERGDYSEEDESSSRYGEEATSKILDPSGKEIELRTIIQAEDKNMESIVKRQIVDINEFELNAKTTPQQLNHFKDRVSDRNIAQNDASGSYFNEVVEHEKKLQKFRKSKMYKKYQAEMHACRFGEEIREMETIVRFIKKMNFHTSNFNRLIYSAYIKSIGFCEILMDQRDFLNNRHTNDSTEIEKLRTEIAEKKKIIESLNGADIDKMRIQIEELTQKNQQLTMDNKVLELTLRGLKGNPPKKPKEETESDPKEPEYEEEVIEKSDLNAKSFKKFIESEVPTSADLNEGVYRIPLQELYDTYESRFNNPGDISQFRAFLLSQILDGDSGCFTEEEGETWINIPEDKV